MGTFLVRTSPVTEEHVWFQDSHISQNPTRTEPGMENNGKNTRKYYGLPKHLQSYNQPYLPAGGDNI